MGAKKSFMLDTNVILHGYKCIESFQENDIYLPIVILEGLDKFREGSEQIDYNACEFVREPDLLTSNDLFLKGAPSGPGKDTLYIVTGDKYRERVVHSSPDKTPDHRTLFCALTIAEKNPKIKTTLANKGVDLCMKARSLGIPVEDYITDKIVNVDIFERAQETYENIDSDLTSKIYSSPGGMDADPLDTKSKLDPNECSILKSVRNSVLAHYNPFMDRIKKTDKGTNFGIQPRNAEQSFTFEVLNNPNIRLVGPTGKTGTGKTSLTLVSVLEQVGTYKQIFLARPIVALANKDLGFLPGDEKQKVAPYMQPPFDNLNMIKAQFAPDSPDVRKIDDMQKSNQLMIKALTSIRGRSLSETYCITDEVQNLAPYEIKTIITRAGEETKMAFMEDIQQIDSPYLDAQGSSLAYMIDKMRGQGLFVHINLIKSE